MDMNIPVTKDDGGNFPIWYLNYPLIRDPSFMGGGGGAVVFFFYERSGREGRGARKVQVNFFYALLQSLLKITVALPIV